MLSLALSVESLGLFRSAPWSQVILVKVQRKQCFRRPNANWKSEAIREPIFLVEMELTFFMAPNFKRDTVAAMKKVKHYVFGFLCGGRGIIKPFYFIKI